MVIVLYIDLEKGALNRGKLVKKPILVRKQDGKTHIRNQWVDPTTGMSVSEGKKTKPNQSERWSTGKEKKTSRDKVKLYPDAKNILYINSESKTKYRPTVPLSQGGSYISSSSEPSLSSNKPKLPDHTKYKDSDGVERSPFWECDIDGIHPSLTDEDGYLKEEILEQRKGEVYPAPLSIRNFDTGLSDYEIDERCGEVGVLDFENDTPGKGTQDWGVLNGFLDSLDGDEMEIYEQVWNNLFGKYSRDILESALGGEYGRITDIRDREAVDIDGFRGITFDVELSNENGDNVGACTRTFYRDDKGTIHQFNDELIINPQFQGTGISSDIYDRQMQLTKNMSGGHPAYVHLTANISVGKYAWAGKGYDFKTKDELNSAKTRLTKFAEKQGMNLQQVLNDCGYKKLSDLKHSWQFAALDNGKTYTLKDKNYANVKGEGHFGKAFMLGGMSMWEGVLGINTNSVGENMYKKSKKK